MAAGLEGSHPALAPSVDGLEEIRTKVDPDQSCCVY